LEVNTVPFFPNSEGLSGQPYWEEDTIRPLYD